MSTTVSIRLWRPEGWLPNGQMFVKPAYLEWHQYEYVRPDQCGHEETICRTCLDTWAIDYEIDLDTIEDLEAAAAEADPDDDSDALDRSAFDAGPCWDDSSWDDSE